MGRRLIQVANIIEDGRLGGPQVRIAEVGRVLTSSQWSVVSGQESKSKKQKAGDRKQQEDTGSYSADNIETTVIFPKYESNDFRKRLEEYNVPYIQLPLHRLAKGWKYLLQYIFWFPFEIIALLRVLKKNRFDVVHVSGGAWQIKGVIAGKFAGCRVLWHLNDTRMPGIIRVFFRVIARWAADGFIVAGERVRKYYVEDLGFGDSKPVFEIQAPVDCSYFNPKKVTPDKRISAIEAIKIVSVGNINPLKGFEYFLYMVELLNQRWDGLHFFVVGPHRSSQKRYSQKLKQIKADKGLHNLTFYGPSSDVREIHKAADIYVCTSIAEASPLSVWEAMAMEKAIVATDVGDISRFITHGENGFIVLSADPEALAYYVGKLVENTELREQFGRKARMAALENLDISIAAKKHLEAYRYVSGQ